MPSLITDPYMIVILGLGLLGAGSVVAGVYLMAVRWRNRTGVPYCLSACVFFFLVYIATFKHSLLNSPVDADLAASSLLTVQIVGQAVVTALGVAIFTLLIFAGYLAMMGPLEFPPKRMKAYAGSAVFCVLFAIILDPSAAVRKQDDPAARSIYVTALTMPSPESIAVAEREAKRTLDALREIGALTRVDAGETKLVHHVRGQFLDLPNSVVKEYMWAALFHHIHFEGGKIKPVILRVAGSDREIAQLDVDGRFHRNRAVARQVGQLSTGDRAIRHPSIHRR